MSLCTKESKLLSSIANNDKQVTELRQMETLNVEKREGWG